MALTEYQKFVKSYYKKHPHGSMEEAAKLWRKHKKSSKLRREETIVRVGGEIMPLSKARRLGYYKK